MIGNLQNDNQSERRRILRGVVLEDSNNEETNGTLQPQFTENVRITDQNSRDTLRTRFSGYEPGAESNLTAVCHTPNSILHDEINLALIQGAPAPDRNRNHFSPGLAFVKNRHRRIHLQRRKSVIDLSQDNYFDYGLPGKGIFS